jgi:hypothetical protein
MAYLVYSKGSLSQLFFFVYHFSHIGCIDAEREGRSFSHAAMAVPTGTVGRIRINDKELGWSDQHAKV